MAISESLLNYFSELLIIATIFLNALVLMLSAKMLKHQIAYTKALIPAVIIGVIDLCFTGISKLLTTSMFEAGSGSSLLLLGIVALKWLVDVALYLVLPKYIFKFEWRDSLLIGAIWFGIMIFVGTALSFVSMLFFI